MIKKLAPLIAGILVYGCASNDVLPPAEELEASNKPLILPNDIHLKSSDYYPVPPKEYVTGEKIGGNNLDKGAPAVLLANGDGVQLLEDGDSVKVWIKHPVEPVVEVFQRFLKEYSIKASESKTADGVGFELRPIELESDILISEFVEARSADVLRAKYQVDIQKIQDESAGSVVSFKQTAYQWERKSGKWEDLPESKKALVYFVNDFLNFFELHYNFDLKRQLALEKLSSIRITMGNASSGHPAFITESDFWVVWQILPKALEEIGFDITDFDQSLGIYYSDFNGQPTESSGWLFGSKEEPTITIDEDEYIIQVGVEGENTSISFLDNNNSPLKSQAIAQLFEPLADALNISESKKQ